MVRLTGFGGGWCQEIEASVYEFRAAQRRRAEGHDSRRLRCNMQNNTMYSRPSATGSADPVIYELKLGRAEDCCRACIAEPACRSWSMLVALRFCQLRRDEGQAGEPTLMAVSGQLVPA